MPALLDQSRHFVLDVRNSRLPNKQFAPTWSQPNYRSADEPVPRLESKRRTERDAEVVVCPVVEVHLVADIETKTKRPQVTLQSPTGIENGVHVISAKPVHTAQECADRSGRIVEAEVHESTLERDERLNRVTAEVEPGTKLTMNNAQAAALNGDRAGAGICKTFREGLVKVVAHFAFE